MKRYGTIETVRSRHETWKTGFLRTQKINFVLSLTCLFMLVVMIAALNTQPETKYFAAREDGGILPIVPVNQPFMNDSQINNFAVEALTRSFTISFQNYRTDMDEAAKYFIRPDGWSTFKKSIEDSGMINEIIAKKLTSSAVANGAQIINQGISPSGRYGWLVQIPLTITYQSASERKADNWIADMEILRVPNQEMSRGVGVMRINMRRGTVR